jgi:hypothetical protein
MSTRRKAPRLPEVNSAEYEKNFLALQVEYVTRLAPQDPHHLRESDLCARLDWLGYRHAHLIEAALDHAKTLQRGEQVKDPRINLLSVHNLAAEHANHDLHFQQFLQLSRATAPVKTRIDRWRETQRKGETRKANPFPAA